MAMKQNILRYFYKWKKFSNGLSYQPFDAYKQQVSVSVNTCITFATQFMDGCSYDVDFAMLAGGS